MAWAREISLTGNFVDAATALRIGIANHVVPHEELLPFTMRLAAAIAEADRAMVATMREDWDATSGTPVRDARRLHMENARDAGYVGQATANGIAARRDAVLDRSRAQRKPLPARRRVDCAIHHARAWSIAQSTRWAAGRGTAGAGWLDGGGWGRAPPGAS
jgi:hypothetical protein